MLVAGVTWETEFTSEILESCMCRFLFVLFAFGFGYSVSEACFRHRPICCRAEGPCPVSPERPDNGIIEVPRSQEGEARQAAAMHFENQTYSEYLVVIYLRRADGIYRPLAKVS